MKNKIIRMVTITLFAVFSFFYTHKTIKLLKDIDPIMKEIKKEKIKYEQPSKNAEIFNDEIIPGYSGIKVDTDKSYIQMKKMNKYNANYYIYKNVSPTISINNNYDKYITKGNYLKNEVSLIFPIKKESTLLQDIYQILENKNIYGTFFIDGIYIKEHNNEIYTLVDDGHEVEVLSYNNNNQKEDIDTARKELKNVINSQGNYCLTNTKDETVLEICKNNNMYTVIPTFIVNSFYDLKNNLESGNIIEIKEDLIRELSTYINYIKQKGYNIVTLEELLNENRTMEK